MGEQRRYRFQHGEMALVLLALLRRRSMHGYDLLAELERVVPGYRASPGSVYPALAALVEEGLLDAAAGDGRRRTFAITRAGRTALDRRAAALAAFEVRSGARLSTVPDVEGALDRLRVRVLEVAERVDVEVIAAELDRVGDEIERIARQGGERSHG
jgi:DNA-binding PadR family transcriptional regulator